MKVYRNSLGALLFGLLPASVSGVSVELSQERQLASGTVQVRWEVDGGAADILGFNILVREGVVNQWPSRISDSLKGEAVAWESTARRSWDWGLHFGLELRHPDQWFSAQVLTPGEAYTIWVEVIYEDELTRKVKRHVEKVVSLPFALEKVPQTMPNFATVTSPQEYLPASAGRLFYRVGSMLKFHLEEGGVEIVGVEVRERLVILYLKDGRKIRYERGPRRPEFLGAEDLAFFGVAFVTCGFTLVLITYFCLIFLHVVIFLGKFYFDPSNVSDLLKLELLKSRLGVTIVLVIVVVLGAIPSWKWLRLKVPEEVNPLLDDLSRTFQSFTFAQREEARAELSVKCDHYSSSSEWIKKSREIKSLKVRAVRKVAVEQEI